MRFQKPIICNATRPAVGPDAAFVEVQEFTSRVGSNTGNMAFLYALTLCIKGLKHISTRTLGEADAKVWGCSNFIAAHREMLVRNSPIFTDGKPMVAIGLGAQARTLSSPIKVPEATQNWVSAIGKMAPSDKPNISLRGDYTYSVLEKYGLHNKCVVLGCPSLFINPRQHLAFKMKEKLSRPVRHFGVAPGNLANLPSSLSGLERHLADMVRSGSGSYLIQHPPELFSLILKSSPPGSALLAVKNIQSSILPEMSLDEFLSWFRLHGRLFDNIPSWLTHLASLDLVIGTRFHGVQLALQAGTPALCIAIDARQLELCQVMRVPFVEAKDIGQDFDLEDIRQRLLDFDWDAFDSNRSLLAAKFTEFLRTNLLVPSKHLLKLASGVLK